MYNSIPKIFTRTIDTLLIEKLLYNKPIKIINKMERWQVVQQAQWLSNPSAKLLERSRRENDPS